MVPEPKRGQSQPFSESNDERLAESLTLQERSACCSPACCPFSVVPK